jgi:hypothetical protein
LFGINIGKARGGHIPNGVCEGLCGQGCPATNIGQSKAPKLKRRRASPGRGKRPREEYVRTLDFPV